MTDVVHMWKELRSVAAIPVVPGVAVRTYHDARDIDAWIELVSATFALAQPSVAPWNHRRFSAEFLDRPWWEPARLWLAESTDDGDATRLLGTVALGQRGSPGPHARATVHWLAVRSDDRGRGVARLLMATLEHACWQRGQRRIHLETHTGWGAALRLYESLGYQRGT